MDEVQAQHANMVCQFLAECVGEAGKAEHAHTHAGSAAPRVTWKYRLRQDRLASNGTFLNACAFGRRIATRTILARLATVNLDELGEVHIDAEGAHSFQIDLVAVGGREKA